MEGRRRRLSRRTHRTLDQWCRSHRKVSVNSGFDTPAGRVAVSSSDSSCTITLAAGAGSCILHPVAGGRQTITAVYRGGEFLEPSSNTELHHVSAPTKFYSVPAQDGWVLEFGEAANAGGSENSTATFIPLGDNRKDRQFRGILSFNTAALPDNAVITHVSLTVVRESVVGGPNPVSTFQGLRGRYCARISLGPRPDCNLPTSRHLRTRPSIPPS